MKRTFKRTLALSGLLALTTFGGTITSYAHAMLSFSWAYETTATISATEAEAMGYWKQYDDESWSFFRYDNGVFVANAYIESFTEPGVYYYVETDGMMMVNDIYDGYIYGEDGKRGATTVEKYFVYNKELASRTGKWKYEPGYDSWYFNKFSDGSALRNVWIESFTEPGVYYFVRIDGIMVTNSDIDGYWVDGDGKCYRGQTTQNK